MNMHQLIASAYYQHLDPAVQMRLDAVGGSTAFARQFEFIEQELVRVEFSPLQSEKFIPYDTSYPLGTQLVTHRTVEQVGQADFVDHQADDLPHVDVAAREDSVKVEMLGVQYYFTIDDLNRAAMDPNFRLDVERKQSAIDATRRKHEEIAWIGSTKYSRTGFINSASVPLVTPITGSWTASTSSDLIVADITKLWGSIATATKDAIQPDTLLLPVASYGIIASKAYGTNSDRTILSYLKDNLDGLKEVGKLSLLDTAGAGSTKRMVAYKKDKTVAKYIAIEVFGEEAPQRRGLKVITPCHGKTGFTDIRKPLGIAYMDGI